MSFKNILSELSGKLINVSGMRFIIVYNDHESSFSLITGHNRVNSSF